MATFKTQVLVRLKGEILDPAGQATERVLGSLGFAVTDVRIGKLIELSTEADTSEEALRVARKYAQDVLANPVMESFEVEVEPR